MTVVFLIILAVVVGLMGLAAIVGLVFVLWRSGRPTLERATTERHPNEQRARIRSTTGSPTGTTEQE